jgi:carboxypeptidase PM20D1
MRTLALGAAAAIVALAAVVLVRTMLHTPPALAPVDTVEVSLDDAGIARHLSEAIRFRTVSYENQEDFPAEAFDGFIRWVASTYPELDDAMTLERPGGYTLLYRWQGTNAALAPVLLTGHYDVVPVLPGTEADWVEPPFSGAITDGVIWGRGALDDKSAVIAQLEAATHLVRAGFVPERTIYFSFGHDEEVGGNRGAASVARLLEDRGERLAWSLDEGSFVFDGMLPGVEPLLATINVAEKGSVTLNIVAHAAGGHSSMPPQHTAVGILADAISRLEADPVPGGLSGLSLAMFDTASRYMPFSSRLAFANRWLFEGMIDRQLSATPFGNAMLRTTTAPTMLAASVKSNVLPIEAVATVNFRIHPRDTVESVIAHVRSVVENGQVEVRATPRAGQGASRVSDWHSAGYGEIATAVREIYGDVVIMPGLMIAGSDSRHYGQVADNAFRFNPMVVTPEDLTGFHGTNEKIGIDNLVSGTRVYVRILRHAAGGEGTRAAGAYSAPVTSGRG